MLIGVLMAALASAPGPAGGQEPAPARPVAAPAAEDAGLPAPATEADETIPPGTPTIAVLSTSLLRARILKRSMPSAFTAATSRVIPSGVIESPPLA